jgi:hypothetical protein
MTIDLKYGLPFVMPFLFVGLYRATLWVAGGVLEAETSEVIAFMGVFFGPMLGVGIIMAMEEGGVKWLMRIGRKGKAND